MKLLGRLMRLARRSPAMIGTVSWTACRDGHVVRKGQFSNKVIQSAIAPYMLTLAGTETATLPITHIGWGAGLTPTNALTHPLPGWSGPMEDPRLIKPCTVTVMAPNRVRFGYEMRTTEGNDFSPTEWALLQEVEPDVYQLFSRVVRADFRKDSMISYTGAWELELLTDV
ncbi:MAG: hypothetical protein SFY80_03125 [Verrucomicrobiota bacterium]|nr:hypothetical protein [Verrucomicrobiota bacterium]